MGPTVCMIHLHGRSYALHAISHQLREVMLLATEATVKCTLDLPAGAKVTAVVCNSQKQQLQLQTHSVTLASPVGLLSLRISG